MKVSSIVRHALAAQGEQTLTRTCVGLRGSGIRRRMSGAYSSTWLGLTGHGIFRSAQERGADMPQSSQIMREPQGPDRRTSRLARHEGQMPALGRERPMTG